MAKINPQRIHGNWLVGVALDLHTLSSVHLGVNEHGHDMYDTTRTELGELLYRLKYDGDRSAAQDIIDTASTYLIRRHKVSEILVPVPPSTVRPFQPVMVLAHGIGARVGLPVVDCLSFTRPPSAVKNVKDRDRRATLLRGLHAVDAAKTTGRHVLLFDDLFRSGATLNAITDVLLNGGGAASVRVLTITRTRSHR